MKVAVVTDWLTVYGGGERVLEAILDMFPGSDLFSLVDNVAPDQRDFIRGRVPKTSFIQRMPFGRTKHRAYLPLMPLAVEQFDLSSYDLIVSSSSAVAKGVITGPDQVHVAYIHTPIRYAWDLQHEYLREARIEKGLKSMLARIVLHYVRIWDYRTAAGVDRMVANSHFVSRRISKVYGRESTVVHPPVDVDRFALVPKEDFYMTASRMVPYKRIPMIVEAFASMPDKRLVVIGDGPEMAAVKARAGSNVTILGYQSNEVMTDHMQRARAFIFAAEEDFGITPVEAQAAGTPVIAYGKGGVTETVVDALSPPREAGLRPTGVFFREQTPQAIVEAVQIFESMEDPILPQDCRTNAERFSIDTFKRRLHAVVDEAVEARRAQIERRS